MQATITTKSGSKYILTEKNGKTFIRKGLWSGQIVKMYEPIRIGGTIHIDLIQNTLLDTPSEDDMSFLRSSGIIDISITL